MTTYFRERIFTPLDRDRANALVDRIGTLLEAAGAPTEEDSNAWEAEPPAELSGLTVMSRQEFLEADEERGAVDVYYDLLLEVEASAPPTAEEATRAAKASGYTPRLDQAALDRLASCHSSIVIQVPSYLLEKRFFIAVMKRLCEDTGDSVVESDVRLETIEAYAEREARELGSSWTKTPSLGAPRSKSKKTRPVREAKSGEVEAIRIHERLSEIVGGDDPWLRDATKRLLATTTDSVRSYAAAILDDGAAADAKLAKTLGLPIAEVAAARTTLAALLESV